MAERYKVEGWGDREVSLVPFDDQHVHVPDEWLMVSSDVEQWRAIVPALALTPVKPPTPEEPEPGAYDIGGVVCVRSDKRFSFPWLVADSVAFTGPRQPMDWKELWENLGGPDVTITRLVPERVETVELPWTGRSQTGHFTFGVTPCRPGGREAANVSIDDAMATITPSVAREMAAALLAFADGLAASRAES